MKKILFTYLFAWALAHALLGQTAATVAGRELPPHPRVLWAAGGEGQIRTQVAQSAEWKALHDAILVESEAIIALPLLERIQTGRRLLSVSRECIRRVSYLAYAWRMTQESRYLQRAEREMLAVAAFSDWNPSHFLDVAEMTLGMALGYDWLYSGLSDASKVAIREAIWQKGIEPSLIPAHSSWLKATHNWNQVCNAGMALGALAVFEDRPEQATQIIDRVLSSVLLPMGDYAPDGAYPEGYNYWGYGTSFNVLLISALETAYGSDFGLAQMPGFLQSAAYMVHMVGATGQPYNYGDAGSGMGDIQPAMFWFANKLQDPSLLWVEKVRMTVGQAKANARDRLLPLALVWGNGLDMAKAVPPTDLQWVGLGKNPVALMRSAWNDPNAVFVGIKGGTPSINHGHMDVGSFVMEANGVRWAIDFGMQDYHSLESKGIQLWGKTQDAQRWQIFRYNNFAHNTLAVNGKLQRVEGFGTLAAGTKPLQATVELSPIYAGDLKQAKRQIAIEPAGFVSVADELTTGAQPATLRWTMATPAKVTITGKRTALLEKDGKKLEMRVLAKKVTMKTWTTEPQNDYDAPNPGTILVGFETQLPANRQQVIRVELIPVP